MKIGKEEVEVGNEEEEVGNEEELGDEVMSKPFKDLLDKMSPESRKRIELRTNELLLEMELRDLRKALDLTQEHLADVLEMKQSAISRIEHQSDMFMSTLRSILSAMGATLKIVASFPEGDVQINLFEERSEKETATSI